MLGQIHLYLARDADMAHTQQLQRALGVGGAVLLGLGSIVGTGVYVSIGIAAGVAGSAVLLAVLLATGIAAFNGLNSAQLAANHPVSGGTYEYGYRYLNPQLGFTAGWTFLLAKSASAATAALGFATYLLSALGVDSAWRVPVALSAVILLTLLALGGVKRSNAFNIAIVALSIGALALFIVVGLPRLESANFALDSDSANLPAVLHAVALMFVAYTGYGRIATMGEEVREPRRTIPRAIILALLSSALLYGLVALVGVGAYGASNLARATAQGQAPLELAALSWGMNEVASLIAIGAIAAMLSVLLNLILGLSRVLLAMGRRGDMPRLFATLDTNASTPHYAVIGIGIFIAGLVLIGNVRTTWSFSAFSVLIYYAITNLAALRLSPAERLFPRCLAWAGLFSCLFLAFWVEPSIWLLGIGLIVAGLLWQGFMHRRTT